MTESDKNSDKNIDPSSKEAITALAEEIQQEASNTQVERFVQSFERSARRWEIIVYPALFAFVVLAGYGFFLIYSLTNSVASIARSMDPNMGEHMEVMATNISELSTEIKDISVKMAVITEKMETIPTMPVYMKQMDGSISEINQSITNMNTSIQSIALTTEHMRQSMSSMNQNVSRPMSFFNSFAPW